MTYWHLQMNQPEGRGGSIFVDSKQMLLCEQPVIGCNIWDNTQSYNFQGTSKTPLEIGDIVLVHEGQRSIALCQVTGKCEPNDTLQERFHQQVFRTVDVLGWVDSDKPFPQPQGTLQRLTDPNTESWKYINYFFQIFKKQMELENTIKILQHKPQIILQGPPGTGKTRLAKQIANSLCGNEGEQKIIQFHPAYSYEDFVRGITAKPAGMQIEYISENRILADFAQKAYRNLKNSQKDSKELTREAWIRDLFEKFKDDISDFIDEKEFYILNKTVSIIAVEDDAFRYTGSVWKNEFRMKFEDILQLFQNDVTTRQGIKRQNYTSGLARTHASYFKIILDKFRIFTEEAPRQSETSISEIRKNFVIIIDEINRANLPAVLGELIYALEYRDEAVESMYEVNGSREIILPSNLYIIGTMNTADRSVGHIDYAIRRRFAFINVPPSPAVIDEVVKDEVLRAKAKALFEEVGKLFTDGSLASDFEVEDVQLGHSYFLAQSEDELRLKLKYEIKPLLMEYLKDGILQGKAKDGILHGEVKEKIESLHV